MDVFNLLTISCPASLGFCYLFLSCIYASTYDGFMYILELHCATWLLSINKWFVIQWLILWPFLHTSLKVPLLPFLVYIGMETHVSFKVPTCSSKQCAGWNMSEGVAGATLAGATFIHVFVHWVGERCSFFSLLMLLHPWMVHRRLHLSLQPAGRPLFQLRAALQVVLFIPRDQAVDLWNASLQLVAMEMDC